MKVAPSAFGGSLSLLQFEGANRGIWAISCDSECKLAEFICGPDCLAERVGLAPGRHQYRSRHPSTLDCRHHVVQNCDRVLASNGKSVKFLFAGQRERAIMCPTRPNSVARLKEAAGGYYEQLDRIAIPAREPC
jgi:hypothetical protein